MPKLRDFFTEPAQNLVHAHGWLNETLSPNFKREKKMLILYNYISWVSKSPSVSCAHAPDSVLCEKVSQWACTKKKTWDLDHFPITRILDIIGETFWETVRLTTFIDKATFLPSVGAHKLHDLAWVLASKVESWEFFC